MSEPTRPSIESPAPHADSAADTKPSAPPEGVVEIGGRASGLDPTRYGDWEKNGRCIDF